MLVALQPVDSGPEQSSFDYAHLSKVIGNLLTSRKPKEKKREQTALAETPARVAKDAGGGAPVVDVAALEAVRARAQKEEQARRKHLAKKAADTQARALARLENFDPVSAQRLAANYTDEAGEVRFGRGSTQQSSPQLGLPLADDDS